MLAVNRSSILGMTAPEVSQGNAQTEDFSNAIYRGVPVCDCQTAHRKTGHHDGQGRRAMSSGLFSLADCDREHAAGDRER